MYFPVKNTKRSSVRVGPIKKLLKAESNKSLIRIVHKQGMVNELEVNKNKADHKSK